MKSAISPVVPRSIDRVKRIAKQLHEIYPYHQLSKTQEVTAHLFFFPDWHALITALKVKEPAGVFDHQLSRDDLSLRLKEQIAIIWRELGGVDQEVNNHRMDKAAIRWHKRLADLIITEITPTLEKPYPKPVLLEALGMCSGEWLATMPQRLAQWWTVNIPHQPIVAAALDQFVLDPDSRISLHEFGGYWGELCVHYASMINWDMAMGTAYLLAERYATIRIHYDPAFWDAVGRLEHASESEINTILQPIFNNRDKYAGIFFEAYPREDFLHAYAEQPDAFVMNAAEVLKILNSPKRK